MRITIKTSDEYLLFEYDYVILDLDLSKHITNTRLKEI